MSEAENSEKKKSRRNFLVAALSGLGGVLAALVAIPWISAAIDPLYRRVPTTWRSIGKVDDFKIGDTVLVKFKNAKPLPWAGETDMTASWVRRESESEFVAFSINCAHLGCPLRWIPDSELFLCPCHGGVYYKDGSYAAGPPPHGMTKYPIRVRNGKVEIEARPIPITTL
jgi:menaquinol-cytochrome c reductase iron-sulfur subunit